MVAGCGMKCTKYIVFTVNFLFFLIGGATVGMGIYAKVDKSEMHALTKIDTDGKVAEFNGVGLMQNGAYVLIAAGAFLFLLGFFGCCGAAKESRCLLGFYAAVVILILIAQIAAAGLAIAFKSWIDTNLQDSLKKAIKENYDGKTNSSNAFSRAFDFAQVYFQCCGVNNGSADFKGSPWDQTHHSNNPYVPDTCCALNDTTAFFDHNIVHLNNTTCPFQSVGLNNPNTGTPCYKHIEDWAVEKAPIVIGIALGIVFVEIMAIVFACCLMSAIKDKGMTV